MRHCAVGKGENHIRTSAWIIFCNIKTSVSLQASDMFWNFKVYIYWVFCWIKIIHQTRNIYPVELINGIVNVLVKFIMYWFMSFFFHDLSLLFGFLMFTNSFTLLTFSPLINKSAGQNLVDWSPSLVQQCHGGLTASRSVTAGVLQGLRMLHQVSGRNRRDNRAVRRYKALCLYTCCWEVRKHPIKR